MKETNSQLVRLNKLKGHLLKKYSIFRGHLLKESHTMPTHSKKMWQEFDNAFECMEKKISSTVPGIT